MNGKLKKKQSLFFRIALAALLVWIVATLLELTVTAGNEQAKQDEYKDLILAQQRENERLRNENANDEFYLEQQAREKGYSHSGEMIFIETPGS
ncbi:MAG: hypothetical protein IKV35_06035 [Clostridia bacterium]|nr:hypothetical protein [Clostridia bacterium]